MFHEAPRFPDAVAFGARGGPQWSTDVVTMQGQREQRNQRWRMPLSAYEIDLTHKTAAEVLAFLAFFATIAQGQRHGFRYYDHHPGEAACTNELLGVGNGSTTTFQMVKSYTFESIIFYRIITKPVVGTVTITLDGTPTAAWTVDTTTGLVTLTSAPGVGVLVRGSCGFDVPVHLVIPSMDLIAVDAGIYTWPAVQLYETRVIV